VSVCGGGGAAPRGAVGAVPPHVPSSHTHTRAHPRPACLPLTRPCSDRLASLSEQLIRTDEPGLFAETSSLPLEQAPEGPLAPRAPRAEAGTPLARDVVATSVPGIYPETESLPLEETGGTPEPLTAGAAPVPLAPSVPPPAAGPARARGAAPPSHRPSLPPAGRCHFSTAAARRGELQPPAPGGGGGGGGGGDRMDAGPAAPPPTLAAAVAGRPTFLGAPLFADIGEDSVTAVEAGRATMFDHGPALAGGRAPSPAASAERALAEALAAPPTPSPSPPPAADPPA
jgi:hypothetical protein